MGKTAKFDGKEGSFGKYGGTQIKNLNNNKGWYATKCIHCDGVAFYHVKDDGYCVEHKQDAIDRLKKVGNRGIFIPAEEDVEVVLDETDIAILKAKPPQFKKLAT